MTVELSRINHRDVFDVLHSGIFTAWMISCNTMVDEKIH